MVERTVAPRDCFRAFHEYLFCNCDFSVTSSTDDADTETDKTDDNDDNHNQKNANNKFQHKGSLKTVEV